MSNLNEKDLVAALKGGGAARELATQQLLDQNIYYVRKLVKKFRLPEEEVLDAFTDGLLLTIEHVRTDRFQQKSKISTYLYQIVFNKCRDLKKKPSTKTVAWEAWTEHWAPTTKGFLQDLLVGEAVDQLHHHLNEMGDPCRQILLDWGYWGYRMEEIAERSGLESADQAKRKKYKCLQRLLKKMPKNG